MKTVLWAALIISLSSTSFAGITAPDLKSSEKLWSFKYKVAQSKSFEIQKKAATFEEAFKAAAKDCYKQMTQGKYPGEEKGLEIIDICANPKS